MNYEMFSNLLPIIEIHNTGMPFKTQFTALVNARGLAGRAINDLKLFWAVYIIYKKTSIII